MSRFYALFVVLFTTLLLALLSIITLPRAAAATPPPEPTTSGEASEPGCGVAPIMIPASRVSGIFPGDEVSIPVTTTHHVLGYFGFVQWNPIVPTSETALVSNLLNPANAGSNYIEPNSNPPDTSLNIGDWVRANPDLHNSPDVVSALSSQLGKSLLLPVWDDSDCAAGCTQATGSGPSAKYRTLTFVRMTLVEVNLNGGCDGQGCLTFEFLYYEPAFDFTQCLPPAPPPPRTVDDLDVALVLDTTGSMIYETICFGCWARCDDPVVAANGGNCTANDIYKPYPANGRSFPFPYPPNPAITSTITTRQQRMLNLIVGSDGDASVWPPVPGTPKPEGTNDYIVLEAEFYSDNGSVWDPNLRTSGQGYWAIQRQTYARASDSGDDPGGAYAIDGYGYEGGSIRADDTLLDGLVRHHPMLETSDIGLPFGRHYTAADAQSNFSPRLEYDFKPGADWLGKPLYINFKAQYSDIRNNTLPKDQFYWAIYKANGTRFYPASGVVSTVGGEVNSSNSGLKPSGEWDWIKINTGATTLTDVTSTYTLKIWAGSGGYAFDRFIISTNSNVSSHWHEAATPGSAQRFAADPCNPIFGLSVLPTSCPYYPIWGATNNLNNLLFKDISPMRDVQEAMRNFTARLDPKRDQVGLVSFAANAGQRAQLECLRASPQRAAVGSDQANYPFFGGNYPNYDETQCNDPTQLSGGKVPISYTVVFRAIEEAGNPTGNTDIADGLRQGLHMLGITTDNDGTEENNCVWRWYNGYWQIKNAGDSTRFTGQPNPDPFDSIPTGHCGRGEAATPMILLLTDGFPTNSDPGDNADCYATPTDSLPYPSFPDNDRKYRCIMYYAKLAAANNVPICTIGFGGGIDSDLLRAVATETRGQYYYAPSRRHLDSILDSISQNGCEIPPSVDLGIEKKSSTDQEGGGTPISYTLTIANYGSLSTTALITDTWTPAVAVTSVDAPGCTVDLAGGQVICPQPDIEFNTSLTLTIVLTTHPSFTGLLQNQAIITPTGSISDAEPQNNASLWIPVLITATPPATVTISGPTSGIIGQVYNFTATVSPITATQPLTYIWQPLPLSGQGTEIVTYRWMGLGMQSISVTVSNMNGTVTGQQILDIKGQYYLPVILKNWGVP